MKRLYIVSLLVVASLAGILTVLPSGASEATGTAELQKTLDELIKQDQLLADRNQQLMEQLEPLREAIAAVQTAPVAIPQDAAVSATLANEIMLPTQNRAGQNAVESQSSSKLEKGRPLE